MHRKELDQLIAQFESHLGCWKQFNYFLNVARSKKYSAEEENQFLELKAVLVQELELILGTIECSSPSREEVHALVRAAPSLRYLSESGEGNLRNLENQWHKVYVGFQALLGQIKVRQRQVPRSFLRSLLGSKR